MALSGYMQTALLAPGMFWLGSDCALEKVAKRTRSLTEMESEEAKSTPATEIDADWKKKGGV